jgi:hypothetical protein
MSNILFNALGKHITQMSYSSYVVPHKNSSTNYKRAKCVFSPLSQANSMAHYFPRPNKTSNLWHPKLP